MFVLQVADRINIVGDLVAKEAKYHNHCLSNFRAGFKKPRKVEDPQFPSSKRKVSTSNTREEAFIQVVKKFEESGTGIQPLSDLMSEMAKYSNDPYQVTAMKSKLNKYFRGGVRFLGKYHFNFNLYVRIIFIKSITIISL